MSQQHFSSHFLAIVVILQVVMYLSLFLDLPLARIVIGTTYLTIVPGLVLVKLLKLDGLGSLESAVYAVGFSVVFLMISGLIINQFGYLFGLTFPLATLPLSLFINTIVIVGAAVAYLRAGKQKQAPPDKHMHFNLSTLLLALLPIVSVVGAFFVNATGNNLILILMILAMAGLFAVAVARGEKSTKTYGFAILMIGLALLLHVSLISSYIIPYGGDVPVELYVFQDAQINSRWAPVFMVPSDQAYGRYNAMLSITILPTVYSNMLGLDPTWVFKIIYPLIFAVVPVALFLLWQPYIGTKFSFIAVFFFMAQSTFFTEMLALNRQMIGELFFVLLLLTILSKKIGREGKFVTFALFSFGLIFSHYALAEIFLFLLVSAWAASKFYLKRPSFNLQLSMILFFFVAMFLWYIYTSGAVVFESFMSFTGYIAAQLGDFFNPASRGQAVLTGLGLAESPSILNTVSRGFAYLTEIFIVVGVIALVRKKLPFRFGRDYIVFSILTAIFLVFLTLIPGLANALSMTRFYHILLMILAPFCVVGIWLTAGYLSKHKKEAAFVVLAIGVLVPYFLFQTNWVYEVAGTESWSIPLSGYRMSPTQLYGSYGFIDSFSVYGAQWTAFNVPYKFNLSADNSFYTSLTAYGPIYRGYMRELLPDTYLRSGEFVFLSYISINYEQQSSNGTMPRQVNQTDVIYSNGGTNVYHIPER
ncbi:MAG: DUF2206 domain-containing protein [Candidatus Bathyarchaeota archaeon]|nr:DUF2206 domain-containing protein [Candidatus Bathyarchaeota archaeon]